VKFRIAEMVEMRVFLFALVLPLQLLVEHPASQCAARMKKIESKN